MKFLNCLIKCQSYARRVLSSKTNLHKTLKRPKIKKAFQEEIMGYHLMNEEPLKEARWEEINRNIVSKYIKVSGGAFGNHTSGIDNTFGGHGISNKTCKVYGETIQVSSYCLSKATNELTPNNIKDVITEIQKRDESFNYYSLLLRDEQTQFINYSWYLVPKDYYVFNVEKFFWLPMMGRTKRTKGRQLGWQSPNARIIFSMGSKLWFNFEKEEIEQFEIQSVRIERETPILSYRCLYKLFSKKKRIKLANST
jgi:hypothetical protein